MRDVGGRQGDAERKVILAGRGNRLCLRQTNFDSLQD